MQCIIDFIGTAKKELYMITNKKEYCSANHAFTILRLDCTLNKRPIQLELKSRDVPTIKGNSFYQEALNDLNLISLAVFLLIG